MEIPNFAFALTDQLIESCKGTEFKPEDFIPTKAEPEASGWDVRCAEPRGLTLKECCYYKIPLGFVACPPSGWWYELESRGSSFIKHHLHSLDGKIDETFPLEVHFCCQYIPDACMLIHKNNSPRIEFGTRIAQIIPVKRQEMVTTQWTMAEMLANIERRGAQRTGGFGSTGTK